MNTAIVNIKIDPKTKREAQRVASDLGLSLSAVIKGHIRQFIETREVHFSHTNEIKYIHVREIKNKVLPVLRKAGVTRAALFGSVVRGGATKNSDIDILVDLPEKRSLLDFVGLRLELEEVLGKEVDLVEYSTIKPRLRREILGNQVQIL